MKINKYLSLSSLVFLTITSCSGPVPKEVTITNNELSSDLTIHTVEQKTLLEADDPGYLIDSDMVSYGKRHNSFPLPITLSWEENNDVNRKATNYIIKISENSDLSSPITYTTKEKSFDVYNLKINTRYYYSVTSNHSKHYFESEVKNFVINDIAPRNLFIEGIENCRDLGGWNIGENKTYKQGMIYRTAQYNYGGGLNTYEYAPTENGKSTLLDVLKIKTDIDLRKTTAFNGEDEVNGIASSPLGNSVKYVSCPMRYGNENIFTQEINKPSIRLFFDTLADSSNYPIAFHCLRGTDRTGALAYLLGAMVGMNEEDLMLDYLFSDLGYIGNPVRASTIGGEDFFIQGIANSDGSSYAEKAKNYLVNTVGVSLETLNSVIAILTE